jgi:hypothetical protein
MNQRGFSLTMVLVALAVLAGTHFGAFIYGQKLEAEGWIAQVVNLEGELHDLKTAGDARVVRAEAAAKKATADLAAAKKTAETERAKATSIRGAWDEHLRVLAEANAGNGITPEAACRADVAAARAALDQVLRAAFTDRAIGLLNAEQLRQLQAWITEASK